MSSAVILSTKESRHGKGGHIAKGAAKVISGMEFVDKIQRGEPPENPDKIVKMRVTADAEKKPDDKD